MEQNEIDILENDIREKYPEVLNILLCDRTTNGNIFWATENYQGLGDHYQFSSPIKIDLITGLNGKVIMPRVLKNKILQKTRVKEMAEVYTPSWICNAQNNLIDKAWFQKENVFNKKVKLPDGNYGWKANPKKIIFSKNKTWKRYVEDKRLEIACGEAPYITSRYDITTGEFIPVKDRIGILDRKLRVINENINTSGEWLKSAQIAFKNTYAYEWQGDSLLLAREAMLRTFIENYTIKFNKEPSIKSIKHIAYILSWNVWQMDGLRCVVPDSCVDKNLTTTNLFGEYKTKNSVCAGCANNDMIKHNGIYCIVKDWSSGDNKKDKGGQKIRFIDLLKNERIIDYVKNK